ncbi:ATP-binding cassette domain-containing protein [Gemelliphila palaticanis]|uniref:ABC transporter ATP-binding protein n=1 Tax=Gemelliphila palaticanis TaxID=81950 RepID=A0ABX2T2K5_9BACL|nr:ABC transporter ATP-binding protein [Gemella palaticanis]MBF0715933.1 ABC transporter ATP-binding protein [Gemella palaticanis]NYS47863.1 ABC transporter ATP-binding protein [Gemella palaticanis]
MKSYILKYKYSFVFIFIAIIIRQLFLILSNYLNADAITILTENNLNRFLKIILYLALVWVIIIAIDRIVKVRQEMFVQNIGISIKDELSNSLINKDVQHYKEKSSGTYQSWFNNDIQAIQNKGVKNIFALLYSISGMMFSLVALFRYHWIISFITILGTLILIYLPKVFDKKIQEVGIEVTKGNERYVSSVEETILGYDTYLSINKLKAIPSKIVEASNVLKSIFIKQIKIESNYYAFNFALNVFFQVLLVFITGYLVITQDLEIGSVAAVGMFANLVFSGMSEIGYKITLIRGVKPIFAKFDEFMVNSSICDKNLEIQKSNIIFDISKLNFSYGEKKIFNDFNLQIEEGKKYFISGPSGSGKSTLLKILTGQIKDYQGLVKFYGVDIKDIPISLLFDNIALIPQKPFIFSGTVRDNINIANFVEDKLMIEYLEKTGLDNAKDFINKEVGFQGENLSGGQKQRIFIVRSLISSKNILLIDEGTSALDKISAKKVEEILLKEKNKTVVMISHTLDDDIKVLFDFEVEI